VIIAGNYQRDYPEESALPNGDPLESLIIPEALHQEKEFKKKLS